MVVLWVETMVERTAAYLVLAMVVQLADMKAVQSDYSLVVYSDVMMVATRALWTVVLWAVQRVAEWAVQLGSR